jgi:hypothetical protein
MTLWTLRVGIALAVLGLALLSPLGDLLPFDFWPSLKNFFSTGSTSSEPVFYRVMPGERSRAFEFALIGIGLALVGASLNARYRK